MLNLSLGAEVPCASPFAWNPVSTSKSHQISYSTATPCSPADHPLILSGAPLLGVARGSSGVGASSDAYRSSACPCAEAPASSRNHRWRSEASAAREGGGLSAGQQSASRGGPCACRARNTADVLLPSACRCQPARAGTCARSAPASPAQSSHFRTTAPRGSGVRAAAGFKWGRDRSASQPDNSLQL